MRTILIIFALAMCANAADVLRSAEQAMQVKQFDKASKLLDQHISANDGKRKDYATYLKALSLYHQNQKDGTIQACDQLLKQFPDSAWQRKALFLKSRALADQKKFVEAEKIYEAEANRLFSSGRKEGLAKVLIEFGDELCIKPKDDEIDAPAPDFGKAIQLYTKALAMDISREVRDEVEFKIARAYHETNNFHESERRYQAYLAEFDPKWAGPIGSPERLRGQLRENPLPAGNYWREVRFHLVEAQLSQGGQQVIIIPGHRHQKIQVQPDPTPHLPKLKIARQNAEDLIKLLGDERKAMQSDTHWLMVRSFNLPTPSATELDRAIQISREFIKAHPKHPRATDTSRMIAQCYQNFGRIDDAIAAYGDFAKQANFTFVPEDGEVDPEIKTGVSCSETFDAWTREAVFMIGQLNFGQKRYDAAITQWGNYIAQFPNGAQWSQCQVGIINAEFQIGLDAVEKKDYAAARKQFDSFLKSHPLDARSRQILFILGQIESSIAEKLEADNPTPDEKTKATIKEHYSKAVAEWERLVSKYANTEESSLALFRIGVIQEEKLGKIEQALATYQRLTWGSSAGQAQQRFQALTNHSLAVRTERTFRTNEKAVIEVTSRNAPKLKLSQYHLNLEAYFRKIHGIGGIEDLDIDLIEPDKTWEVEVENYEKYKPTTQQIAIPFDKNQPGVCVIKVEEEDFEATTMVIRSDIEIITKASRRELLVFAQNIVTGKPAAGVELIASNGKEVFGTGKTGKDGVFRQNFHDTLKDASGVGIFASGKRGIASTNLGLQNLGFSEGLSERGYIYTEKPAYRPGETVNIRGILRDVTKGSYSVPGHKSYSVRVLDPKNRMLQDVKIKLDRFGAFDADIDIDAKSPLGNYTIQVSACDKADKSECATFNGNFQVQRYKLEKVKLAFEFTDKVIFRGETISAKLMAKYYWGSPAANELVEYTLPDGRRYSEKTDENGEIKIEFDPSGFMPGRHLNFQAIAKAYNVVAREHVFLASLGFSTTIKPSQKVALAGEPFDVVLKTTDADGKPISKELTLKVLRREASKADPVLSKVPWIQRASQASGEVTIEEHKVTTDEKTGVGTIKLDLEKGGIYILRSSGNDRFDQVVTASASMVVSDDEDHIKLRFFADSSTGKVGSDLPVRLHSRLDKSLALLTFEGEEIISHRIINLKKGYNPIDLTPAHEHFPNFRMSVAAIDDRDLRTSHKDFIIERELKVTLKPRNPIESPGANASVDLLVTDQNGKPVEAALSVALVNQALYSLYSESVPPILDFFQASARRNAEFRISSTCAFSYQGRTNKVVKSITQEKERLERRQKELAKLKKVRESGGYGVGADMFGANTVAPAPAGAPNLRRDRMAKSQVTADFAEMDKLDMLDMELAEEALSLKDLKGGVQAQFFASGQLGGGGGGGAGDGGAAPQARKDVMNASRWISPVVTDAKGKATITIPLPESTTEWRLTARGCTTDSLVGQTTTTLITRKDFFLELKTPVLAQEGDKMQILAKIHNLTDFEGEVALALLIKGGNEAKSTKTIEVKGQSVTEILFDPMTVPLAKIIKLTATAITKDLNDALEIEMPVRPWGLEFAHSGGGMTDGNANAIVALPKDREYSWRELEISLSPSIRHTLIDYALRGNARSQADGLLAAVAALNYAVAHKAPEEDIRILKDRARALVASLTATQRDGGDWQWNGHQDLYQTCRSYWAVSLAQKAGIPIQSDLQAKTRKHLKDAFSRLGANDNDNKSMILHALSTSGHADFAHLNRIHRERAKLSNNALALTAVALVNQDRKDFAGELVELLEKKVQFDKLKDQPVVAWWKGSGYTVLQDRNETTAIVLLALSGTKPDSPLADQAANLLLRNRGRICCYMPQALGSGVVALSKHYANKDDAKADFEIKVMINNEQIAIVKSKDIGRNHSIKVPAEHIKNGDNVIRFEKAGPGSYTYSAVISGFSKQLHNPNYWKHQLHFKGDNYYHDKLTYRGVPLNSVSTSPVSKVAMGDKIRVISRVSNSYSDGRRSYRIREEYLPAGMLLVDGSLKGNFQHHEIGDGMITMYYRAGEYIGDIHYELVAYAPGTYKVLPGTIRDYYDPQKLTISKERTITVLPPGEKSDDPYQLNRSERYELADLNFKDGNWDAALKHLQYLYEKERHHYERDVARMLLWIHTMDDYFDAKKVVEMFEILRERHPSLVIPFDKILIVGKAYRVIGEHERAWLIFRATIDSSFINDASLSAILEDQGQFIGGIEYMDRICKEYPDTPQVVASYFALSQQLYDKAPKAHELVAEQNRRNRGKDDKKETFDRISLLKLSLDHLHGFLTLYPKEPLADDAAFSMANAYFALEDFETVVKAADGFRKVYPESTFVTSFQYMAALGHFWQYHYEEALASAAPVTESKSKDRDYARYITAQIHHALGTPAKAIEWYRKVSKLHPDAADAIAYFEEKKIEMDEVTTFKPKDKPEVELRFRNIKEAYLQIYKVDLMKLYLREKNLSNITKVHLAGIEPEFEMTLDLGDGKDYRDRDIKTTLPIKDEGAYLVICRGDDLFTSGMVLVTPLKLEIQETPGAGSLRVNVRDTVNDGYQAKVHVKAIGSHDDQFKSGDTDLRGIFVAEGLRGAATVIARQNGRYAFYRGSAHLGQPVQNNNRPQPKPQQRKQMQQQDFLQNLELRNSTIQDGNIQQWESLRRGKGGTGVEIQKAY